LGRKLSQKMCMCIKGQQIDREIILRPAEKTLRSKADY